MPTLKLNRQDVVYMLLLAVAAIFFYGAFARYFPVTDTVESNYVLTAREMLGRGDWLSPVIYGHFWYDKPILTYWTLMASFSAFGFTDLAARVPFILCAALNVMMMYYTLRIITLRRQPAIFAALFLGTSFEFWYISHAILTDGFLFLFTQGIFIFAYRAFNENSTLCSIIAYAFAALAVLTKGPVGIVLPGLVLILYVALWHRNKRALWQLLNPWGWLAFIVIAAPWYVYMYSAHGMDFINGFFGLHNITRATTPEHPGQNWWFLYIVLLPLSILPWSGLALYEIIFGRRDDTYKYIALWGIVFFVFYNIVATKYLTYTFPCVIPLIVWAALGINTMKARHLVRPHYGGFGWIIVPMLIFAIAVAGGLYVALPSGVNHNLVLGGGIATLLLLSTAFLQSNLTGSVKSVIVAAIALYVTAASSLAPLLQQASAQQLAYSLPLTKSTQVYYYHDYRTSLVYYSQHPVTQIYPNGETLSVWDRGKDLMPTATVDEAIAQLKDSKDFFICVPAKYLTGFKASPLAAYAEEKHTVYNVIIFGPKTP